MSSLNIFYITKFYHFTMLNAFFPQKNTTFVAFFYLGAGGGATRTRVTKIVHWTIFTCV